MTARPSTLAYALLGLLAREPLSGYDLARQMKGPIRFFWHARHSQIYPELARLQAAGWVTHEVVPQADRPAKKVYTVTDSGRAALRDWVAEPMPLQPVRDELTLKAFSLWLADPAAATATFREQARQYRAQQAAFAGFEAQMQAEWGAQLDQPTSPEWALYATLRRGLGFAREAADWAEWVTEQLERAGGAADSGD